jgi:hypothetical protein
MGFKRVITEESVDGIRRRIDNDNRYLTGLTEETKESALLLRSAHDRVCLLFECERLAKEVESNAAKIGGIDHHVQVLEDEIESLKAELDALDGGDRCDGGECDVYMGDDDEIDE